MEKRFREAVESKGLEAEVKDMDWEKKRKEERKEKAWPTSFVQNEE